MAWNKKLFELLSTHVSAYLGGVKEKSCYFQGQEWKYLDAGSGEVILCLHGIGGTKVRWRPFMTNLTNLTQRYRVISPDIPGMSLRVEFPDGATSRRKIVEWIDAFMDACNLDRVHLVCHGSGGVIGSYFVDEYSHRVCTLTWFNPPDLDRIRSGDVLEWEQVKSGFDSLEEASKHMDSMYYQAPQYPDVVKRFFMTSVMQALNKGQLIEFIDKEEEGFPILISKLRSLQRKTLLVAADHDVLSSDEWILKLVDILPDCELRRLADCGQRSLIEKPDQLAEIYLNFLKIHGS